MAEFVPEVEVLDDENKPKRVSLADVWGSILIGGVIVAEVTLPNPEVFIFQGRFIVEPATAISQIGKVYRLAGRQLNANGETVGETGLLGEWELEVAGCANLEILERSALVFWFKIEKKVEAMPVFKVGLGHDNRFGPAVWGFDWQKRSLWQAQSVNETVSGDKGTSSVQSETRQVVVVDDGARPSRKARDRGSSRNTHLTPRQRRMLDEYER